MTTWTRTCAVLGLVLASSTGCTTQDVGAQRRGMIVDPGDPASTLLLDAGSVDMVAESSAGAFPHELAFRDAGRDAECHDACEERCGDDEICCWSTGLCVPLDCWECCSDSDPGRAIQRAAAEAP